MTKYKYHCPMCGWEGTDDETSTYIDFDEYLTACPKCVCDYINPILDVERSKSCQNPVWKKRSDFSWNLKVIEIIHG